MSAGSTISQGEILQLLLPVKPDVPVYATPGFAGWLPPEDDPAWPPPPEAKAGIWLVDTRDRISRERAQVWRSGDEERNFEAALVLSGSGPPESLFRRIALKLRGARAGRLPPEEVVGELQHGGTEMEVTRLGFEDGPEVPFEFRVEEPSSHTGQAFLLTHDAPFSGDVWESIRRAVGDAELHVVSFQIRVRGAAVLHVGTDERDLMVRVAPSGGVQNLVHRNHAVLKELREDPDVSGRLLDVLPDPVFEEKRDSILLLGETRIEGTLAWKLASGPLEAIIRRDALDFLSALKQATLRPEPLDADEARSLLDWDLRRLEAATFVGRSVRSRMRRELQRASEALIHAGLRPHASHGDYGYGNLLVHPDTGELRGVIDWGTCRELDYPGIDRVNLEVQIRRTRNEDSFPEAVRAAWRTRAAHDVLEGTGDPKQIRALFGLGVCRIILRSLDFTDVYRSNADDFRRALHFLDSLGG